MFDIPGQVRKALTDFFAWMVASALNPVLGALGRTLLSTPNLTANEQVRTIWTVSLVTANGIFGLFLLAGAFTIASHHSLQSSYGFKQVAPRLAAGAVLANVSLLVCGKFIALANAVCASIAGQGVDPHTAAEAIIQALAGAVRGSNFLMILLVLGVLVMAIVALITFILRIVFLVIVIGVAPLALMCHALPQTESLAYTWWRAVAACFGIQIGQAVILLASVRVFLTPKGMTVLGAPAGPDALMGVLVCLTMLWLLVKLPGWMRQFVLGPLGQRNGRGLVGQILHTYLTLKTLGAAAGILGGAGAARTAATATRRGPGPGAGRTTPRPTPPRQPRPGAARSVPPPAGPVAFSHAPVTHTPLAQPAGSNSAPTFSHPSAPATPQSASGGVAPAQFSHPTPPQPATPTPSQRPAPVRFTTASTTAAATSRANPGASAPPVVFSSAPAQHTAPKRPPAPVTPVYSSAPSVPSRPTAARRASTPSPHPVPTARSVPTAQSVPARSAPSSRPVPVPTPRPVSGPRPVPTPRPVPGPRPVPTPRPGPVRGPRPGPVPGPRPVPPA
ncbi:MAG TPA: hypothetical protein VES42_22765, partial [Pilimelia sp.]|nr:hypothetical protein [Pilimelia sp.]